MEGMMEASRPEFKTIMLMVVFWLLIFGGIFFVYKASKIKREQVGQTPLDILKARYAKGDITKEEYNEKKKELEK